MNFSFKQEEEKEEECKRRRRRRRRRRTSSSSSSALFLRRVRSLRVPAEEEFQNKAKEKQKEGEEGVLAIDLFNGHSQTV